METRSMSTYDRPTENSIEQVPASASFVGIDADGDRHYLANPITAETIEVYVTDGATVETYDLAETPCADQDDTVEAWIQHTARKRGDWEYIAYERPAVQRLAESGAI